MNFKRLSELHAEIKISLEDEGLTFDQATTMACLAHKNNLPINMKIGGAEAISDLRFTQQIGCTGAIAPMIESKYALHKFISSIHKNSFSFKKLYIIIETKQAYQNIVEILNSEDAKYLDGIILGRTDFTQSFGYTKDKVDSVECKQMAIEIFKLAKKLGLSTTMGGNINSNSITLIQELYNNNLLDYIESRNVKIKLSNSIISNYTTILRDMIEFESNWLSHKHTALDKLSTADKNRLETLNMRNK